MHKVHQNTTLVLNFTKRQLTQSSKGTVFGLFWLILDPLIGLVVYTAVFGYIFDGTFNAIENETRLDYALGIFVGLITYQQFVTVFSTSINLIRSHENLVKKVRFPLEILPLSLTLSSFFTFLISFVLFLVSAGAFTGRVFFNPVHFLVCAFPLFSFTCGVSYLFASLGVFFRDLSHFSTFVVRILLYGSAIFFSADMIPEPYWGVVKFNPLLQLIDQFRSLFLWGHAPKPGVLLACNVAAIATLAVGVFFFQRTKKLFPDVL